ncbi:polysaccharide lyase-like protein [Roseimicrobium gellanilyticum]|uniref:Polysaccharide lyase-like protein n=1 Tax=Roseimicrobium gellanilyticum TaxID=748857 RepID=A0A366HNN6_9BACT|nr:polysaccharide lyase [Roseimicrobium gellanilyticum]RBP44195.1 polysaccharide lyase-like protein [Roseimicrobium gellanilyticum]
MKRILANCFLLALFLTTSLPAQAQTSLLRLADFETGDLSQLGTQKVKEDSLTIVTSPVRAGKFAARTLLRASDPETNGGQRAEFSDGKRITKIEMEKEYWYGLSIYIPEDFVAPTKSNAVLFQWHTQQGGPSPVLAIRAQAENWLITGNPSPTEKKRTLARMPFEKGRWTDWVVHVRWSAEKKGFWTIWKDGTEVVRERDIITQYPEALGPYAKFGQYHSVGEVPQNVVYFDEYRVAGADGSYEAVAPPNGPKRGSAKPAPTSVGSK